jgi:hypothetical protein
MLPEAQEMRQFARILGAQARIAMALGDLDEALAIMRVQLAMTRHVSNAPTFVNGLIGIAVFERGLDHLREFVQLKGAPNLYWALSTLPQPLVDFRDGMEVERRFLNLTLQEKADVDANGLSADQWQQRLSEVVAEVQKLLAQPDQAPAAVDLDEAVPRLAPLARQALVAAGRSQESVDAMADAQVVLAEWLERYYRHSDDSFCAWHLDYAAAMKRYDEIGARARADWDQKRDLLPLEQVTPGYRASRRALARLERSLAALRVVEALRLHAAAHDGRLPAALADVEEVPIPLDPITGQAFDYRLEGAVATIKSPEVAGVPLDYRIRMAGDAAE